MLFRIGFERLRPTLDRAIGCFLGPAHWRRPPGADRERGLVFTRAGAERGADRRELFRTEAERVRRGEGVFVRRGAGADGIVTVWQYFFRRIY